MAQPKAMRQSPRSGRRPLEQGDHVGVDGLRLEGLVVEVRRQAAGAGHPERLLVVGALDAEALGQAPAPGPLLAHGLVAGPGHDVVSARNASKPDGDTKRVPTSTSSSGKASRARW